MRLHAVPATLLVIALNAANAFAHPGTRIHVGAEGGQIKTYLGSPNTDAATSFTLKRIFFENLPELVAGQYLTDFPGFELKSASGVSSTTSFAFSIAGPLKYFDYDEPSDTGTYKTVYEMFSPGTVPQIAIAQTGKPTTVTSTGTVTGFEFFQVANQHGHVFFVLFGNGASSSDGPNGVYALPLVLQDISGTLTSSEPFWILFDKNVDTAEYNAAIAASPTLLIPEPGTIGLLACGLALSLARRRRRV